MRHILIFLYLCLFNGTTVALTKRKFGQCLPVSLMVMPLVMYFVQFACGSFRPAYVIMLVYAAVGIPLALIRWKTFREQYFTLGLLAFIVACGFVLVLDYRNFFSVWDEMSHWGPMTKSMVRLDAFYTLPEARLETHRDYPPYMQLFETMWCVYAGGFSEMACNYAIHTFSAGIIVPVIAENYSEYLGRAQGSRLGRLCRNVVMMILLMAFYLFTQKATDGGSTYGTIYKDIVTALLFVYGMMLVMHRDALRDWFGYLALILDGTALLLTKQMGMCYVMVVLFYYLVTYVVDQRQTARAGTGKAIGCGILRLIPLAVIPYGINHIWTSYTKSLGYVGQFDLGQIRLSDILAMAQDTYCETPQRQAFNSYINALFSRDLFLLPVPVSFLGSLVIVIALLYVANRLRSDVFCKGDMLAAMAAFTCGTLGYALTMGILYLFCYSEDEMLGLASYERYLAPYVYGELILIACIYIDILGRQNRIRIMNGVCAFAACAVLLGASNLTVFVPEGLNGEPYRDYQSLAARFDSDMGEGESVYFMSFNSLQAVFRIYYYADHIEITGGSSVLVDDLTDATVLEADRDEVFGCDYLYVADVRDQFNETFAAYNGGEDYIEGALYRVERDGDDITVTMVDDGQ